MNPLVLRLAWLPTLAEAASGVGAAGARDGERKVNGQDKVVGAVVEPYRSLVPAGDNGAEDLSHGEPVPETHPSGRMTNGPRKNGKDANRSALEAKYPALKGRSG